jgi:ribosome assembly protein 1
VATSSTIAELDLKSSLLGGFDLVTQNGPLCDEPLQGSAIILEEVQIAGENEEAKDPYGPFRGQIMSTMRDGCKEAVQKAGARIVEGVYICTLQTT